MTFSKSYFSYPSIPQAQNLHGSGVPKKGRLFPLGWGEAVFPGF